MPPGAASACAGISDAATVNFTVGKSASVPWVRDVAPDVTTNRARPEGRLVVIMFDWSIRFEDQMLAQRIGRAAVDQLGPDDLAAVVFSSGFANGGVPENFTADRTRLVSARCKVDRPSVIFRRAAAKAAATSASASDESCSVTTSSDCRPNTSP